MLFDQVSLDWTPSPARKFCRYTVSLPAVDQLGPHRSR
jgi:hypothetical protein